MSELIVPDEDWGRQAIAALRGYAYQISASALAWLQLSGDDMLLLEVAEDFALLSQAALELRQSKDTVGSGSLTLRTVGAVKTINALWRFQAENPTRRVSIAYLTTSTVGREKGIQFPGDLPGVLHWREAAREGNDVAVLRDFLLTLDLEANLKAWLATTSDEEIKSKLLRRIRWECGQLSLTEINALLLEKLVLLCQSQNAPASSAEVLRARIISDLLTAVTTADPAQRRRTRAQLLELAERAISVSVPIAAVRSALAASSGSGASYLPMLERLDALPPDPRAIERPTEEALWTAAAGGRVWLSGASGMGKTSLARTVSRRSNRVWYVLDLRDVHPSDVARRLREGRRELAQRAEVGGLAVDDLPLGSLGAARTELALLATQLERADASLLITAYRPPPPTLTDTLRISPNAVLEVPYFTEAETAACVAAAGGGPNIWARRVHLFCGGGHPQLVAARITGLSSRGWPMAELADGLAEPRGPRDVEVEREAIRLRLFEELPESARTLLYRLSLLIGTFDRELAIAIGSAEPPVPQPGSALDLLTGPWIEPLPSGLRLSPLVQGSATQVMTPAETRSVHAAIADQLCTRRPFPGVQLMQLLLSSLNAGHERGLTLVAYAAMSRDVAPAELRNALFLLPLLSTDKPLVPHDARLNRLLRLAQLKVASAGDDAARIDLIYRRIEHENVGTEGELLLKSTAAFIALSTDDAPIPPTRWFEYLADLEGTSLETLVASNLETGRPVDASNLVDENNGSGDFARVDLALGIFTIRVSKVRGIADLKALFEALEAIGPLRRARYLNGLPEQVASRQVLVQLSWLRDAERPNFDALASAATFALLQAKAKAWGDHKLAVECLCARVVLLAEYAEDNAAAVHLLDEAESAWPREARLTRERFKIYFRQGRFAQVRDGSEDLLAAVADSEPAERTHATREVALSAGETGDLPRAIDLLRDAEAVAGQSPDLAEFRVGLAADRAFLIWRSGRRAEAVAEVRDALSALEALDQRTPRGEYLVRAVSIVVRAMYQDLTNPGWDRDFPSLIGVASRPPRAWTEGPPPTLLSGWYQLAWVERRLGSETGVGERLKARTRSGKIISMEFIRVSTEYLSVLQGSDLDLVAEGLSEFARAAAYAQKDSRRMSEPQPREDLFDAVPEIPWEGAFDPGDEVQRAFADGAVLAAVAFGVARGDLHVLRHLRDLKMGDAALRAYLALLPAEEVLHPTAGLLVVRLWAITSLGEDQLAPQDLLLVSIRIWEWLADALLARELARALAPRIASHWARVAIEARFALRSPAITAPAIQVAAAELADRPGLGRLILCVLEAVRVTIAPDLVAALRAGSVEGPSETKNHSPQL